MSVANLLQRSYLENQADLPHPASAGNPSDDMLLHPATIITEYYQMNLNNIKKNIYIYII